MCKNRIFFACLGYLLPFSVATTSFAEDSIYLGVDIGMMDVSATALDAKPPLATLSFGKFITPYVALEFNIGFGIDMDEAYQESFFFAQDPVLGTVTEIYAIEAKLKNVFTLAVRGEYPIAENLNLTGSVGYSQLKMSLQESDKLSGGGEELDLCGQFVQCFDYGDSGGGVSYSLGAFFNITSSSMIHIEYVKYPDIKLDQLGDLELSSSALMFGYQKRM
ncbi:MAG: outer membrane beta-barrel protein [Gammaproteobacteria bacterium]|jgi:hypothetical protein